MDETGQIINCGNNNREKTSPPRPQFPAVDWRICPNLLAYALSWYGLFVGKFPFQTLCFSLGLCVFFSAGMYRIQISDLKPEDYLPTDSRSNKEREINLLYDIKKHPNEWTQPIVHFQAIEGALIPPKYTNTTRKVRSLTSFFIGDEDDDDSWRKVSLWPWTQSRLPRQTFRDRAPFRNQNCRSNSVLIIARRNETDPDGGRYNLLSYEMLNEIRRLERHIFGIWVQAGGNQRYYYADTLNRTGICTRGRGGSCSGFNLRTMSSFVLTAKEDPLHLLLSPNSASALTYPNYFLLDLSPFLGGVQTRNNEHNGFVERVVAIREVYCINEYQPEKALHDARVWLQWEDRFDQILRRFRSPYMDIYWITEKQKQSEQNELINNMLPKIGVAFVALMLWCAVGAVGHHDAIKAKPWSGFIGVLATMLATSAGFGFCLWQDSKFSPVLMAVPLLTLAIGLDDMFIILEAWSRTSAKQPVEERLMLAMRQGGTSIFITFIINLLDFVIGNYTPYPIINYLSNTATVTTIFDFFCQMTIFCSALTLFARNEPKNRHSCLCCFKVPIWNHQVPVIREQPLFTKWCQFLADFFTSTCCSNFSQQTLLEQQSMDQLDPVPNRNQNAENVLPPVIIVESSRNSDENYLEPPEPYRKQPFVDFVAKFLFSNNGRLITICGFIIYLALSSWSLSYLDIGLRPERVFRQNSNLYDYMSQQQLWFSDYTPEVVVLINKEVDYSNQEVQTRLLEYEKHVEESDFFWGNDETSFWLRDYLTWYQDVGGYNEPCCSNVSQILADFQYYPDGFLMTEPYGKHARDLRIDVNSTRIFKSRLRFRAKKANNPERQIKMMETIRLISDPYKDEFNFSVYSSDFLLYDQFLTAVPATLYYSGITLGVTIGVALFMVPHLFCIIWVGISVVSILVGVIGMMRCWDMDLDSVTLINLLIAITLSADFVTHAAYVFLNASPDSLAKQAKLDPTTLKSSQVKIFKAHVLVGEIAQAAILASIGTILSVLAMSTSDAYIFVTFFRILFLTIVLSLLHALVFLPVFLSIFGPVGSPTSTSRPHTTSTSSSRNAASNSGFDSSGDGNSSSSPNFRQNKSNANLAVPKPPSKKRIGEEDVMSTCSEPPNPHDNGDILDSIFLQQSEQSRSIEFRPLACSTKDRRRRNTLATLGSDAEQILEYFGQNNAEFNLSNLVSRNPIAGNGVGPARFHKRRRQPRRNLLQLFSYHSNKGNRNKVASVIQN